MVHYFLGHTVYRLPIQLFNLYLLGHSILVKFLLVSTVICNWAQVRNNVCPTSLVHFHLGDPQYKRRQHFLNTQYKMCPSCRITENLTRPEPQCFGSGSRYHGLWIRIFFLHNRSDPDSKIWGFIVFSVHLQIFIPTFICYHLKCYSFKIMYSNIVK